MMEVTSVLAQIEVSKFESPVDDDVVELDVRELGPPQPLVKTLKRLKR